jgi:hypothetical protein
MAALLLGIILVSTAIHGKRTSFGGATSNSGTTFYAAPSGANRLLRRRYYNDFAPTEPFFAALSSSSRPDLFID